MSDDTYAAWQIKKHQEWEAKCGRCGACCGAYDGDPCEHLRQKDIHYYCNIYANRFGTHKTISGKEIKCVPIRDILHASWPGDKCCGYKQHS